METQPKAYSYSRFSTPEQAQGDSRRRQVALAEEYAARHGLDLDESLRLTDKGVSGYTGANVNRGALGLFLSAVEQGDVPPGSYLLIESLDRLSRQTPWETTPLFQMIINAGVILVTLFDGKRYDREEMMRDPMAMMTSLMVMIRANEESATKAKRLRAVWEAKRSKAREKPLTGIVPAWLKLRRGKIEIIEDRAAVVGRIVDMALSGAGQHRIAEKLNTENVPVFGRGQLWGRSYIKKIIENPALIGTYIPHRTSYEGGRKVREPLAPIDNYFPAVIAPDQWAGLQALVGSERRAPQVRHGGIKNALASLARCPQCSSTMTRVMKGHGNGTPKLVCVKAKAGAGCEYRSVNLEQVEAALREAIPILIDHAPHGDAETDRRVDDAAEKVNQVDAGLDHIVDQIREAGPSPALTRARVAAEGELEARREELKAALRARDALSPRHLQRRLSDLADAADGTPADLNLRLRSLIGSVTVDYQTGTLRLQWLSGDVCDYEPTFAWPDSDGLSL